MDLFTTTNQNEPGLELGFVLQRLYQSEINAQVSTFFAAGLVVKLGSELAGWQAETIVMTAGEAATWLDEKAREYYPHSKYVKN